MGSTNRNPSALAVGRFKKSKIEYVRFVDHNGRTTFECSEAEASCARDAVHDMREYEAGRKPYSPFKRQLDSIFKKAHKVADVRRWRKANLVVDGDGLNLLDVARMWVEVERKVLAVTHCWVSPARAMDMKLWDIGTMDYEYSLAKLRDGVLGSLWGAMVLLNNQMRDDEVLLAASFDGVTIQSAIINKLHDDPNDDPIKRQI